MKRPGYRLLIVDEIQRLRYCSITSSSSHFFYHARSGFFLFAFVLFCFCCKTVLLCMLLHNCDLKAGEAIHPIFTDQVDQDKKCTRHLWPCRCPCNSSCYSLTPPHTHADRELAFVLYAELQNDILTMACNSHITHSSHKIVLPKSIIEGGCELL